MGMMATVMNALALESTLKSQGLDKVVIESPLEMNKILEPYYFKKAIKRLQNEYVVIMAAGTGYPYFTTDTAASLRAIEIEAEILLMAKNGVDGYVLIVLIYLVPFQINYNALNYAPYKWINLKWLETWAVILYFTPLIAYFSIIFISKNINWIECLFIFIFSVYIVCAFKAMTKFMLESQYGWSSVIWLTLIIIVTDSFAFIGGVSCGKHKLAPEISPNKTWEGIIIGSLSSIIITTLYALLLHIYAKNYTPFDWYGINVNKTKPYIVYIIGKLKREKIVENKKISLFDLSKNGFV